MRKEMFLLLMCAGGVLFTKATFAQQDVTTSYSNYDFVPGDKVIFEENFAGDQNGEFPAHLKLESGQGVVNNKNGVNALLLTQGNYALVSPRMKTPSYLTDPFTLELDYLVPSAGGYGVVIRLFSPEKKVDLKADGNGYTGDTRLNNKYPGDGTPNAFRNKWHHLAIVCKNKQLKMYLDQYRTLVDPDFGITPASLMIGGIGSESSPVIITNLRIAAGGGMNMVGKKFTDSKIITHGINFDYDKATLRPESMGTLNMIKKIMDDNPEIKFEVGGHTDGDGDAAYNLKLSQQRADAVRDKLISMGISGSRLSSKGYGKSKPIADNGTDEGKANNRRVEFVKG